ncbi:Cytosolic glutathione S-transferase 2B [Aphelenchoides besseyi]|nr:Cytosolic glutathione S-transferase 2B [Aphelenchoides besseyi]
MHLLDNLIGLVTMPKYQLKYLNLRAKGEPIRLLLNFVQESFEDHRENYYEFAKNKDRYPMPRLPQLIVDGKLEICYTVPILKYLARKHGLDGESDEEKAQCDVLGARIAEYQNQLKPWVYCLMGLTPPERLDELTTSVFIPVVQQDYAPVFENHLEKTNTGYLVGDKLTWIDFMAACFTDMCVSFGSLESLENFRRLNYHRNAVFALPQIQEHLKNRPDTVY